MRDFLLAAAVDALFGIDWRLCGCPGASPPSFLKAFCGRPDAQEDPGTILSFDSPESFEAALHETERRIAYGD